MTVTADSFVGLFSEFDRIDPAVISQWIAIAYGRCDAALYNTRLDEAVGLLTAHLLWNSPSGNSLRLDNEQADKKSRYWREFIQVRRELGLGFMVVQ
jgi:hypothetical protein